MSLIDQLGNWRRFDSVQSRSLAAAMEGLILAGALVPDEQLPSERDLARRLGVSRTLIVNAYDHLRDAGWIATRRGSGTRVLKGPPGYLAATRRQGSANNSPLMRKAASPTDIIDVSVATAQPDPAWLQLSVAARSAVLQQYPYQPFGMPELREHIAAQFERQGLPTRPQHILVTNGAQQALALVAQRYARGKRVLVEDPTYFGTIDCLRAAGAQLTPFAAERDKGGPMELARRLEQGQAELAFVTPTVQNPTSLIWTEPERRAVVRAATRHEALLVVDDTLGALAFGEAPPTLACFAPQAPIITIGSLSKTLWGGLRIGWLRAGEEIVSALAADRVVQDLGSGLLSSALACDLFPRYESLLEQRRHSLRRQRDACIASLGARLPEWRFATPEGGPFLWIELPGQDGDAFARCAAKHGVLVTPGSSMRAGAGPSPHIRLSYTLPATVWDEVAARLERAWRELCTAPAQASSAA